MGEVQGYSHSHSDHTLQDAIVYCLRRGGGMSETNVEPTNYLEMVEQLRHDRDKYIGMWRSQCNIAEEVMRERDRLTAERDRYKEALEILSSIYFYGNFKPETYNESLLEQMLTQFGLWPTTEDEIIKRSIAREALKEVQGESGA